MSTQPPKKRKKRKVAKKYRSNVDYLDSVTDDSRYGSVQGTLEQVLDAYKAGHIKPDGIIISWVAGDELEFKAHGLTYDNLIIMAEKLKHYSLEVSAGDDGN